MNADGSTPYASERPHPAVLDAAAEVQAEKLARKASRQLAVPASHPGYLTVGEMDVLDHLSAAASGWFRDVEHPAGVQADLDEFAAQIHILQARVMARAASRAYPDRFRHL